MQQSVWRVSVIACVLSFPANDAAAVEHQEPDFRALGAPPEVHLCESAALLDLVGLTAGQREQLDARLDVWKAEYLRRQAEIDKLPADDVRGRRGWPPTRDRDLAADIRALMDEEQQQRHAQVLALWNYGPVRTNDAHNRRYQEELNLTAEQYVRLHELQLRWIENAWPFVTARGQPSFGDPSIRVRDQALVSYQALVVIGTAGWKFKSQRDAAWTDILSAEQARRWRQIELQRHLVPHGVRFLVTGRSPERTSSIYAHFVPYFESPATSLQLSEEQQTRILEICQEYENSPAPYRQPGKDREARIAALRTKQRQFLEDVEEVLTNEQTMRWHELLGEPTVYTRWLTE